MSARRIQRLDPSVVNRIAAGEIIQRPSNGLKEMIENSLDAGATSINVTFKGLQLLQVVDNGQGIAFDDFPLVCERFATSKLTHFDDLKSIQTYGFRGEALASLSYVAKVTITSMTRNSPCAYRATFLNGQILGVPIACAGNKGTTVQVEDMFYNIPARRDAFKSTAEEYHRVLDVVTKYSLHCSHRGVSFTCRRGIDVAPDVSSPAVQSRIESVGVLYGSYIQKNLFSLEFEELKEIPVVPPTVPVRIPSIASSLSSKTSKSKKSTMESVDFLQSPLTFEADLFGDSDESDDVENAESSSLIVPVPESPVSSGKLEVETDSLVASFFCLFSSPDMNYKRGNAVIFINDRLVDCPALKRTIDDIYSRVLARGTKPFYYLSLQVPSINIDVNVNSTKRTVGLLYESEIVGALSQRLRAKLDVSAGVQRDFLTQVPLVSVPLMSTELNKAEGHIADGLTFALGSTSSNTFELSNSQNNVHKETPSSTVRVSHSDSKIDRYFVPISPVPVAASTEGENTEEVSNKRSRTEADSSVSTRISTVGKSANIGVREVETELASVRALRAYVNLSQHPPLLQLLKKHTFVGLIDRELALLQYGTSLWLVNHCQLSRELFYQRILDLFGCANKFPLQPAVAVRGMLRAAAIAAGLTPASNQHISDLKTFSTDSAGANAVSNGLDTTADDLSTEIESSELKSLLDDAINILRKNASILNDCFSISLIESQNNERENDLILTHLPRLVDLHTPSFLYLPDFLLTLVFETQWDSETECFHSIAQSLAAFYSLLPTVNPSPSTEEIESDNRRIRPLVSEDSRSSIHSPFWIIEHAIMPAVRMHLKPPIKLIENKQIIQLTSTEQLYRVFERC